MCKVHNAFIYAFIVRLGVQIHHGRPAMVQTGSHEWRVGGTKNLY